MQKQVTVILLALFSLFCALYARFPPVVEPASAPEMRPIRRAMFAANVLAPFVTIERGPRHVDAVQRYSATGQENALLRHIYPSINKLPVSGINLLLDPEIVLQRDPDVVFIWQRMEGALRTAGINPLISLHLQPQEQVKQHIAIWRLMGRLTGNSDRAEALLEALYQRRWQILDEIKRHRGKKPRILLIVGGFGRGYWLGPTTHNFNERFTLLGAQISNRSSPGGQANIESILMLNPDIIFLSDSGTGDGLTPQQLYARPEWRIVRAVQQRQIYKMPSLPGFTIPVEDPIRLQWLAEVMYPDVMTRRLRHVIHETLHLAYDIDIGDDEIDRLIHIQENALSRNYQRFSRQ